MSFLNLIRDRRMQLVLAALCIVLSAIGCDQGNLAGKTSSSADKSEIPKLDFHKPESLDDAVARLRELHAAIVAQQPLPEPLKYEVVEVIHGEGAGAHSHYYLAYSYQEGADHHDHTEMASTEKRHEIEVDVFTEFQDIVNWLPKIAAASDGIEEESWRKVKEASAEISRLTTISIGNQHEVDGIREAFRSSTSEIEELINDLDEQPGAGEYSESNEES